jgi:hypothetical protein
MTCNQEPSLEIGHFEDMQLKKKIGIVTSFFWLVLLSVIVGFFSGLGLGFFTFFLAIAVLFCNLFLKSNLIGSAFINLIFMLLITWLFYILGDALSQLHALEFDQCSRALSEAEFIKKAGFLLDVSCSRMGFSLLQLLSSLDNTLDIPLFIWTMGEVGCQVLISYVWYRSAKSKIVLKKYHQRKEWRKKYTKDGVWKI